MLERGEENDRYRYVNFSDDSVCFFLTIDDFRRFISNMGKNLTPYIIAIGEENIYFLTPHFKFIEKDRIGLIMIIYWKQLKIIWIHLIIISQIVEKTLLKRCDYTKFIQLERFFSYTIIGNEEMFEIFVMHLISTQRNLGIIQELDQVRKWVINNFHETIPVCGILISLSIIDDEFLQIHDENVE